jgi:hypothetical protein
MYSKGLKGVATIAVAYGGSNQSPINDNEETIVR